MVGSYSVTRRVTGNQSRVTSRRRQPITLYNALMSPLHSAYGSLFFLQLLISAFFAILFLQSGVDKIIDRRGNLEWLTGHFAKSPLAGIVGVLFSIITMLELAAGALSAIGCIMILLRHNATIAFYGATLSALALLALFFGQRMAKD